MQRAAALLGSAIFLLIAPGALAVLSAVVLHVLAVRAPLFPVARGLGAALAVAGLPILLDSFAGFALNVRKAAFEHPSFVDENANLDHTVFLHSSNVENLVQFCTHLFPQRIRANRRLVPSLQVLLHCGEQPKDPAL
jgi:hypothetical protein